MRSNKKTALPLITNPEERLYTVRPFHKSLCHDNLCAATILGISIDRHNRFGWTEHHVTQLDLRRDTFEFFTEKAIRKAIKLLFELELILPIKKKYGGNRKPFAINFDLINKKAEQYHTAFPLTPQKQRSKPSEPTRHEEAANEQVKTVKSPAQNGKIAGSYKEIDKEIKKDINNNQRTNPQELKQFKKENVVEGNSPFTNTRKPSNQPSLQTMQVVAKELVPLFTGNSGNDCEDIIQTIVEEHGQDVANEILALVEIELDQLKLKTQLQGFEDSSSKLGQEVPQIGQKSLSDPSSACYQRQVTNDKKISHNQSEEHREQKLGSNNPQSHNLLDEPAKTLDNQIHVKHGGMSDGGKTSCGQTLNNSYTENCFGSIFDLNPQRVVGGVDINNPHGPISNPYSQGFYKQQKCAADRIITEKHYKRLVHLQRKFGHKLHEMVWFLKNEYTSHGYSIDRVMAILNAIGPNFTKPCGMPSQVSKLAS